MSVFWQSVLAVFAAVGFYALLHTVYELVSARVLRMHGSAELTLYGDGCDAASEQLIRVALRIRRQYLPGLCLLYTSRRRSTTKHCGKLPLSSTRTS